MTIALLCPTRGRPQEFKRMVQSLQGTVSQKVNLYVAIQGAGSAYETGSKENVAVWPTNCPDWPTAFTWNRLAEEAMKNPDNKLFMLCADDVIFSTPLWDSWLLEDYAYLENKIHCYHLRDSRNEDGTPHPIVTREWIEATGWFLPPLFMHWFVDSWTVDIAKYCGAFTHMKDYLLIHDKPSDRGEGDETHNRIRQMGWHDRDKWTAEKCKYILEFEKQRMYKHFSQAARVVA